MATLAIAVTDSAFEMGTHLTQRESKYTANLHPTVHPSIIR